MSNRRVVVTGIGLVSSLGIGTSENWKALLAGRSGVETITKFDASQFATQIAGEVRGFDPLQFIEKKDVKKMDVFIQYAIAASQFAMDDARLTIEPDIATRVGVFIASGIGGFTTIEREHKALLEGGPRKISPFFIPSAIINLAAGQVSIRYGAKGPELGDLHRLFGLGARDRRRLRDHPARRGRHHDRRRVGSRDHADGHRRVRRAARAVDAQRRAGARQPSVRQGPRRLHRRRRSRRADSRGARAARCARGARIYAELVGYGMSADAYHITAPSEDGDGALRVMNAAIDSAGISREQVAVHQRARHVDAAGRQPRTLAIKRTLRRSRGQARGVVDQVDDRPSARRGRRPRSRHHRAGGSRPGRAAHDQSRLRRSGVRPRLRAEAQPPRCRSNTRCRTHSASAAPTPRCCSSDMRHDRSVQRRSASHELAAYDWLANAFCELCGSASARPQ